MDWLEALQYEEWGHYDLSAHLWIAGEVQALEFRGWWEDWNPPAGTLPFGILPEGGWRGMSFPHYSSKDQNLGFSALSLKQPSGKWRTCQGKTLLTGQAFGFFDL